MLSLSNFIVYSYFVFSILQSRASFWFIYSDDIKWKNMRMQYLKLLKCNCIDTLLFNLLGNYLNKIWVFHSFILLENGILHEINLVTWTVKLLYIILH